MRFDVAVDAARAIEEFALGDAGGSEDDVAGDEVAEIVATVGILDAEAFGLTLFHFMLEGETRLHLAADAAERRSGEDGFRRLALSDIHVDAGFRHGGVDDA